MGALAFPNMSQPFVDQNGYITQSWRQFLLGLATDAEGGFQGTVYVTPEAYRQASDPDWTNAWNAALATGYPVWGDPSTVYGISGNLTLPAITRIKYAHFQQLTPNNASRRTLYSLNGTYIELDQVTVDRNGTGAYGSFNNAAAIWIQNAKYFRLTDCEVIGNDMGAGIHLINCPSGGVVDRAYIHDMTAGTHTTPNPGDGTDQIAGIWSDDCTGVTITSCVCINLLSQSTAYAPENINTRGFTGGGPGTGVAFVNCFTSNVDEGFDMTGNAVMVGYQVVGCRAEYCRKFGFKAAVTASHGRFMGCYAYRCTLDGFYFQGSNQTISPASNNLTDVQAIGCVAEETGYNVGTYYPGYTTSGFRCDVGSVDASYARNCRFVDCRAFGGTNMQIGFNNSIGVNVITVDRNRIINCSAADFTELAQQGFVDGTSTLSLNADQSIPSGSNTPIVWSHVLNGTDGLAFLNSGSQSSLIFIYPSRYAVQVVTPFEQGGSGNLVIEAFVNGNMIPGQRDIRQANTTGETTPSLSFVWDFALGDELSIQVSQSSGISINVNGGDSYLRVTDLNSPPQLVQAA